MAEQTIQNNVYPVEPDLTDALNITKKEVFLDFNCHNIATIQSFNPATQTVEATINYKQTFFENNQVGEFKPVLRDYPLLVDCPAVVLGGGTATLTMPIAQGDQCLILFNDRDMDNWFKGSINVGCATPRMHSFADCIALVGLRNANNLISNYDTVRAVLRNGNAAVGVRASNNKVLITGSYPNNTTTLNSLIQDLITAIKAITVTAPGGGGVTSTPINSGTFTSIGTQIGAMLE